MGLKELVRYLALVKLCNNVAALKTFEMYFIDNRSPGEISRTLGIARHTVRGYIDRVIKNAGGFIKASMLVRVVVPHIASVKPVIETSNSIYRCRLCGLVFMSIRTAMPHIRDSHRDVFDQAFESVITSIKRSLVKKAA
jgi:hypothetical protein